MTSRILHRAADRALGIPLAFASLLLLAAPASLRAQGSGSDAAAPSPLSAVAALRQTLGDDLQAALRDWRDLQSQAEALGSQEAGLRTAALDFDLMRNGLQACFGSPSLGSCEGAAVKRLREYAGSLEPALDEQISKLLESVDRLRIGISDLVLKLGGLNEQAGRARQEVERLSQEAFLLARRTDENPLESATVKTRMVAEWRQVLQERDEVTKGALRIEREARPLEAQVPTLRARVLEELSVFGAASAP